MNMLVYEMQHNEYITLWLYVYAIHVLHAWREYKHKDKAVMWQF